MNGSTTHPLEAERTPFYRISFAVYVLMTVAGCIGLMSTLTMVQAATILASVAAPALALSMAFHTPETPPAYVFVWITAILIGGAGISFAVML